MTLKRITQFNLSDFAILQKRIKDWESYMKLETQNPSLKRQFTSEINQLKALVSQAFTVLSSSEVTTLENNKITPKSKESSSQILFLRIQEAVHNLEQLHEDARLTVN